ncbi:MAG TPA: chemotaxis protein CheA, partial [Candidatus Rifleibacterium sp.]|nr:chemotaxis protein CheA [Candidatus Rifleibacterium sp.]
MKKISIDTLLRTGLPVEEIKELLLLVGGENTRVEILPDDEETVSTVSDAESVEPIGEILVKRGDLTHEALDKGLKKHKPIGQELVEEGLVSPDKVAAALAEQNRQKEALARKVKVEKISTIRVASDKLDRLFNLIGELVTV